MADMFQRYEASSASIREIARKSNTSATSVADVRRNVEDGHRSAVKEADRPSSIDGSGPPSSVDRQPLGPVPDSMLPRDPYNRWDGANNATFLAIMALDGLNNSQQADYNRHYATEVTFQENTEGYRRAVINLYQVQSDGTEVRVNQSYGMVDPETGEIVPAPSE